MITGFFQYYHSSTVKLCCRGFRKTHTYIFVIFNIVTLYIMQYTHLNCAIAEVWYGIHYTKDEENNHSYISVLYMFVLDIEISDI